MNKLQTINSQEELEQLILRYFDGETSLDEERLLQDRLADCPWSSETIDEAKFTMGYFVAHQQHSRQRATVAHRWRIAAIAATAALLLSVGLGVLWQSQQPKGECIAYVNGKVVHNEKEVLNLMQDDLNEIGHASQSITEQLSSLGEAIEIDI